MAFLIASSARSADRYWGQLRIVFLIEINTNPTPLIRKWQAARKSALVGRRLRAGGAVGKGNGATGRRAVAGAAAEENIRGQTTIVFRFLSGAEAGIGGGREFLFVDDHRGWNIFCWIGYAKSLESKIVAALLYMT
jgi:hypothetical protein